MRLAEGCDRCGKCCSFGSGFLVPSDFPRIARVLEITEKQLKKYYLDMVELFNTELFRPKTLKRSKPYGKCIFYNEKEGCTINSVKPLQCKVTNPCSDYGKELDQWFLLNYVVNKADPESLRQWATYLKFNEVIPGGQLSELVPEREKLSKILSYKILK